MRFAVGGGQQRPARNPEPVLQDTAGVPQKKSHVHRHLVIAAAAGVQPGRGGHPLRQRLLDVHVHILQPGAPAEPARPDFAPDPVQPRADRVAVLAGDQPDVREHGRMRPAALKIKDGEAPVARYRLAEFHHEPGGFPGETPAPSGMNFRGHTRARSSPACGAGQLERSPRGSGRRGGAPPG